MDTQVEILDHSKSTKRDEVNPLGNGESKNTKKSSKTTTKKRNTKKSDAETTDNGNSDHSTQAPVSGSSKKRKGCTVENHVVKKQKTKNGNEHSVNDSGDDDVITNGDSNAPSSPKVSEREAASEIDESSTVSVNEKRKSTSKAKSSSKQAENHRIIDESSNMTNHTEDEEAIDIEGTDPPVKSSSKKKKAPTTSKKKSTTAKSASSSSKKKKPSSSKAKNEEERIDIDEVSKSDTDLLSSPLKEEPKHNDKSTSRIKEESSVNGKDDTDVKSELEDKSDIIEVRQNDEPITVEEVDKDVKIDEDDSNKRIILNDGSTDDNSNINEAKNSDDDIALMEIDDPEPTNQNNGNRVDDKNSATDDIKSNTDSNNHVLTVPVVSDLKNKNKKKYTSKTKTKKASTKKNSKSGGRNSDEHKTSEGSSPERIEQKQQELEKLKKYKEAMHNFNDQAKTNPFCVTVLSVFVEVMDELCLEICQEVHRKIKTGNFCVNCDGNGDSKVESGDGEKRMKDKIPFVKCDAGCGRTVAATRYAPHLEKCLGLGKSRNRRRPVALEVGVPTKPTQYFDDEELDDGQDGNYEGFGTPDPKKNKLKPPNKSNNKAPSSSPPAPTSAKSADLPLNTQNAKKPLPKMKQMNIQAYMDSLRRKPRGHLEKILKTKCGVISVKTGKMCTKSLRCPQHNDEMRAQIRSVLLDPDFATGSDVNSSDMDMMDITNENSNEPDDVDDVEFTDD
jgi:SAGA-associated factor 11